MLIIKKYGGSSLSSPEKILAIAKNLKKLKEQNHDLIVVVSAMGDTTDTLIELTRKITTTPIQREMDMLLSAGERISMAMLAIALNSMDVEAISFTGSQSGVFTDSSHANARINDIKAIRVKEEIARRRVVIIAGFQGVNPLTKEVTTLGRGGSDTTAVAMAAAFQASRCDILTDVEGIFTGDPRIENLGCVQIPEIEYDLALEMTYWGASVLHFRSVELAERYQIPITVNLSLEMGPGTLIKSKKENAMEQTKVIAVNSNTQVACLNLKNIFDLTSALEIIAKSIKSVGMATPQIIYQRKTSGGIEVFLGLPEENFDNLARGISQSIGADGELSDAWNTVTLTGRGLVNSQVAFEASASLKSANIIPEALIISPLSLTFLVLKDAREKAIQTLHGKFI